MYVKPQNIFRIFHFSMNTDASQFSNTKYSIWNKYGHISFNCSKPQNLAWNVISITQKHPDRTVLILFKLCQQLDENEACYEY